MADTESASTFALTFLEPAALLAAKVEVVRAEVDPRVVEMGRELVQYAGAHDNPELADYERFAILGVCAGFAERQLSPFVAEHVAIVPPLLAEIRAVYGELHKLGTAYDPSEFRLRAFHYGVHKASYLDWCLYLSKECY